MKGSLKEMSYIDSMETATNIGIIITLLNRVSFQLQKFYFTALSKLLAMYFYSCVPTCHTHKILHHLILF